MSINNNLKSYRNEQKITPYEVFNFSLDISFHFKDYLPIDRFTITALNTLEYKMYCNKYVGDDEKKFNLYKRGVINSIYDVLTDFSAKEGVNYSHTDSVQKQYNTIYSKVSKTSRKLKSFFELYQKEIEKIYRQKPIKTSKFPCFTPVTEDSSQEEKDNQKDQELLSSILERSTKSNDNSQEKQPQYVFSQTDLLEFYDVLCKPRNFFAFSPTFVFEAIEKLDNFLNGLQHSSDQESNDEYQSYFHHLDSESDEFKCFHLILLIKMRLFANINQIYNFLSALIELIVIEQEKSDLKLDDKFSYQKILQEVLPDCLEGRSKIIKKVSSEEILDFCFSNDNEFILTKDGIFKISDNKDNQIEYNPSNLTKINFDQKVSKIAFSNGVLYLFNEETNEINKIVVSEDEEIAKKEDKRKKKLEKAEEHLKKENEKEKPAKKEDTKKKLREKEKKEKRLKRKAEKNEIEKREFNNQAVKADLPAFPVLSIGAYKNYIRIAQRKSDNENKTTLILTNVDLAVNDRINYDIEDAFNTTKEDVKQTQTEFEVENGQSKMKDVFFSEDYLLVSFEDSSIQQWIICNDGRIVKYKLNISPLVIHPKSVQKMDNNSILYNLVPIRNEDMNGVSITKMYIPETDYCINNDNSLFLKYSYLYNFSNIVDNCSQVILNYKLDVDVTAGDLKTDEEDQEPQKEEPKIDDNIFNLTVSPNEMGFLNQSLISGSKQMEKIKRLIKDIKDESLKQFFINLSFRIIGIGFYYDLIRNFSSVSIEENTMNAYKKFRTFILDLYESSDSNSLLRESMMMTLFIGGKYLFIPDSYEELRKVINEIISNQSSQLTFKCLLPFLFSLPSSLYIIDQTIYEHLLKFETELGISNLFMKNSILINTELLYITKTNEEIIEFISPYLNALFKHINSILSNDLIPIIVAEELLANIFSLDVIKVNFSLILEKELIGISKTYYERVRRMPGVVENDEKFVELNSSIKMQEVKKEIRIVESQHPYNLDPLPIREPEPEQKPEGKEKKSKKHKKIKKYVYIDLGTVDFGVNANKVYIQFDPHTQIYKEDKVLIYHSTNQKEMCKDYTKSICIDSNKVRIAIRRSIDKQPKENKQLWGIKMTIYGVNEIDYKWISNKHLFIFNTFILSLAQIHQKSFNSTEETEAEKDFKFIMNENIIQGIKTEDIKNYEENLKTGKNNQTKKITRKISRGISRGISYDSETKSLYDEKIRKEFINGIIMATEDSATQYKKFLDFIYTKTSKRNFLRLNQSTKSILDIERYFAACLFKQLGLITKCLHLYKIISETQSDEIKNIELPSQFSDLWKKNIYPLRNKLLYAFQKSRSNSNSDSDSESFIYKFNEYSEEIKNKCILLLYSDPILKFKDKGNLNNDAFESAMKSIFSFVTSKSPLSDINKIIDVQRKRLEISSQSLSLILPFIKQNSLFNSSKAVFALFYNCSSKRSICKGLNKHELDEYEKLLGSFSLSFIQNIFVKPTLPMILNADYLYNLVYSHNDNEARNECAKLIINQLELNKNNKTISHDRTNFTLVLLLSLIVIKSKNNDLADYVVSLLSQEDLDSISKKLILLIVPLFIEKVVDNTKLLDESFVFSLLNKNSKNPVIVKSLFYWISSLFTYKDLSNHRDFIMKVLKGIGSSFIGKSCLFLDESFKPFVHRQVCETMISFIRLLFNSKNELLSSIIHEILTNKLKDIKFEDENVILLIGLFASFGVSFSPLIPDGALIDEGTLTNNYSIIGFDRSCENVKLFCSSEIYVDKFINTNIVLLKKVEFNLNDDEIENILHLNEIILNSKYFNGKESDKVEITENILISTFYSFLSFVMQNVNNMEILLNEKNIKNTLSICEIANHDVPANINSLMMLSHYLEEAITNSLYNDPVDDEFNESLKFMKMNFGEIIYNKQNDIIKTNKNYTNIFLCNRIFDFETETYFNIKVDNFDSHSIFLGFIDSEECKYSKSFGFEKNFHDNYFYRKTPIKATSDQISYKDIKSIGCYYTKKYVYLLINGCLTPYRVSHPTLQSYIPIIYVDHDELEITVLQNVTIVDHSNNDFAFLNTEGISFEDIKEIESFSETSDYVFNSNAQRNEDLIIGQESYINMIKPAPSTLETNDEAFPASLLYYKNNPGIIKDISIIDDNEFLVNVKAEVYNRNTLSYEIVNFESKYNTSSEFKYFNLVENRTNTRFGLNSSLSVKHLLNKSTDLNSIKKHVKNKTIYDNSKSIAIITARHLVFILLDYLRFSKSNLLKEEGIDSNESQIIINALAHSLPTITEFSSSFTVDFSNMVIDDFLIFSDEQTEENEERNTNFVPLFKIPGIIHFFNVSFIVFMKKTENLISPKFLLKLIQASYEISNQVITLQYLYDLIPSKYKIESCSPLPEKLKIKKDISLDQHHRDVDDIANVDNIVANVGFVPILMSSIPDQLPSASCFQKNIRLSSDKISYYASAQEYFSSIILKWEYDIGALKQKYTEFSYDPKDYKDYELKLGFYCFTRQLPEFIANSSFGFIHILLLIFRSINYSEYLYKKHKGFLDTMILEKTFSLVLKRNPLVNSFIEPIILAFSSSSDKFSDILLSEEANESFSILSSFSNILYPIYKFPDVYNETPLIFSIYTSLVKAYDIEKRNEILNLFDNFVNINDELFEVFDIDKINNSKFSEGTLNKKKDFHRFFLETAEKKKNYRLFYQLYYYSILLNNENNLPYPKFLFYHDWIRQHFGSFRFAITKGDLNKFDKKKNEEEKELHFKSESFNNDFDLECSCKLINIFKFPDKKKEDKNYADDEYKSDESDESDESDDEEVEKEEKKETSFKVFVHQLKDDKRVEVPQTGEKILVSFPLEILIYNHDESYQKQLIKGDSFIIDFAPSKEEQKKFFVNHYEQFQDEFNQFILLSKYDTQLSLFAISTKEGKDKEIDFDSQSDANFDDLEVVIDELSRYDSSIRRFLNDPDYMTFYLNFCIGVSSLQELSKKLKLEVNREDFTFYELERIPSKIDFDFDLDESKSISQNILSLRYWILSNYSNLIEEILINYTDKVMSYRSSRGNRSEDVWSIQFSFPDKKDCLYSQQIIKPAFSMNTESKFRFINQILMNDAKEVSELQLTFNRFESQRFSDSINKKEKEPSKDKPRPLFIQFMEQIDPGNLHKLKVHRGNPFRVDLVGEKAIDAGGPSREIFSNLIIDLMNNNIGVFTSNPNHRNELPNTNKEDLIPNIHYKGEIYDQGKNKDNDYGSLADERFQYAGALIAVCIVSDLPQQMKLASFVWEYMTKNKIENAECFYEIDEEFKKLMKEAESCKKRLESSQMTVDEFNEVFVQTFKIKDSFGNQVDLVPSGSKKKVTSENLSQFIELAKNFRIHEFDNELYQLKKYFDIVMTKNEITSILRPNELKLLVCGEPDCPVEQMKNLISVNVLPSDSHVSDFNEYSAKMTNMFWNVIESFSVEERIGFIRFTSGSNGLPAVGLNWQSNLKVNILSKEETQRVKKILPEAQTCFSTVKIFYFENEVQLAKVMRTAIQHGGLITDEHEIPEGIENFI